jgi:hypothetical protein
LLLSLAVSSSLADDTDIDFSMLPELMKGAQGSLSPQCVSDGIIGIVRGTSASATTHVESILRSNFISLRTEIIPAPSDILDWDILGRLRTPGRDVLDHDESCAAATVRDQLARSSVVVMLDASAMPYIPALRPGVVSLRHEHDKLLVSQNALPQELVLIESGWSHSGLRMTFADDPDSEHSAYLAGMDRSLEKVVSDALKRGIVWRRKYVGVEECTADDLFTLPRYRLPHFGHTVSRSVHVNLAVAHYALV